MCWHTHTHPFNGPFPGLPGWAGTRKVKPIWILLEQKTVSGSGISWAICKSAPRSRQITTPVPHHSVFYRPDALPAAQPTASKYWRPCADTVLKKKYCPWSRVWGLSPPPPETSPMCVFVWQATSFVDVNYMTRGIKRINSTTVVANTRLVTNSSHTKTDSRHKWPERKSKTLGECISHTRYRTKAVH